MHIHIHALSNQNPPAISYCCALLIQGIRDIGGIRLSGNFDNSVVINCNASIGRPRIVDIDIHTGVPSTGINILVVDDNIDGLSFSSHKDFWSNVQQLASNCRVIVINSTDSANIAMYPKALSRVFIAHASHSFFKDSAYNPQSYGVSTELIEESTDSLSRGISRKPRSIFHNFGRSLNQTVRQAGYLSFITSFTEHYSVSQLKGTGDVYAAHLASQEAMFVYGGNFTWRLDDYFRLVGQDVIYDAHDGTYQSDVAVVRWDSWRFWECCLFACAPIMLDFEFYGLRLPVLPVPWKEYIPVRFDTPESTLKRLADHLNDNPVYFQQVGLNARKWAIQNYSPAVRARRILDIPA